MQATNQTIVNLIFSKLRNLHVLLPGNETTNQNRARQFAQFCTVLNEFYILPEHYCPFYFDRVSCWNATAPNTTAIMPCVSWQFARPNYAAQVQLKCNEEGRWQKVTGRELMSMYKICKLPQINPTAELSRSFAQLGYTTSAITLIFAIFIFLYLRKLKCGRNVVHFNLFISLLLRSLFSILQYTFANVFRYKTAFLSVISSCKVVTALWNYFILCSYFWICVEGLYLHNVIYFNVFTEPKVWPYAIFGWVAPLFICACWTVFKSRVDHTNCWLSMDQSHILKIPLILITLLDVACAANIARQLYSKLKDPASASIERDKYKYRKLARSTIYLICGTGVNFFIFDAALTLFHMFSIDRNIAHSVYVIINSFWGLVAATLYCFHSEEIRSDWRAKRECRHLRTAMFRELNRSSSKCDRKRKSGMFWKYVGRNESTNSEYKVRAHSTTATSSLMTGSDSGSGTISSTIGGSAQSMVSDRKYTYPVMKVIQLNLWKEENETSEV